MRLHHQCCAGLSTVNCPADALVAPTHQRLSMPAVTPDTTNTPPAAGLLAKGISSGHLPIRLCNNTATGPIPIRWICRPSPSVLRRFVHRELSCRCAGGADPPTVVDAVVTPDTDNTRRRRPCLRRGYRLDIYLYDCANNTRLDYTIRWICGLHHQCCAGLSTVNCLRCAGGADPPTVVDAVVTPDATNTPPAPALLAKGISSGHLPIPIVPTTRRWTYTIRWICRLHHQCCARFVHRELSADALVAPTHQRLSMPVVTPDTDQYAAAAAGLRRGYRLDIYLYRLCTTRRLDLYLYGGYAGLHHQCCAGLSTVNCLPMRWWRDPPTVVDAVVTPDATNTRGRGLLAKGISSGHLPIPIVPTTRRLDLYYTVDMRPSPSVLRQVCPRELSCRCAGGADPPTVVDACGNTLTPTNTPPAAGLLAKGISSGHLPIPIVQQHRRLDLYLYGGYAAFTSVLRQVCPP
jgi:uncharacterized protein YoaH (UPF0181 family)